MQAGPLVEDGEGGHTASCPLPFDLRRLLPRLMCGWYTYRPDLAWLSPPAPPPGGGTCQGHGGGGRAGSLYATPPQPPPPPGFER